MTNNDVLRSLRYSLNINNQSMIEIFALTDILVTKQQVIDWLVKEEEPGYQAISDVMMASFLNGLIILRRGKKDGAIPQPETTLNHNIIFRKLKIAFDLKDDDILALLAKSEFKLGKHELSAFFRRADHKHYRECHDQVLRYFLRGIQLTHRPDNT
ncbi:YehS family protein [Rheinheimera salexigens]|uniref:DUF1456 domain-containing protein n=1 Tax=Rheinheimera salexigens TaxID=1628148 RepID=A0A1E7Q698_9GAMM|nr:DUF1456 family protein [Rheinheimera salexigens]OEY69631.1 hypothetical protein BI198_08720 [Rheinheimera salexigens]